MRSLSRTIARRSRTSARPTTRPGTRVTKQLVTNRRWLHRNQLRIGMYVNELDRPWSETRFLFQGFVIDTPELLADVQESCEYAYVETQKLASISSSSPDRLVAARRTLNGSAL